ncbi:Cleavage stimulation factor subunit 1 [Smittium culicis]|uniref:Cleavage stimulation factor 50 kDa subunit n=1 Tax=Smittium culicis TaxID=133412 RepID=A0A1R1YTS8_9FUNG|nr:Cleavage stimulation factor subunit 1 [Smittium culicis]
MPHETKEADTVSSKTENDVKESDNGFGMNNSKISEDYSALKYEIWYQTSHKGAATAAAFSDNGQFFATGSADSTLKLVSIERLKSPSERGTYDEKPVIRALYDHRDVVNQVTFHSNGLVLASCSDDQSIKLFDLSLAQGKRSFRFIQDNSPIKSISFHPSGEYLASGTASGKVVLYDIKSLSGVTPNFGPSDRISGIINSVKFSKDGKLLGVGSSNGDLKIVDGITGGVVLDLQQTGVDSSSKAKNQVHSIEFTRNSKYVLTSTTSNSPLNPSAGNVLNSGSVYQTQLWDTNSGKVVQTYNFPFSSKPGMTNVSTGKSVSCFNFDENLVLAIDPFSDSICCWDSRTGRQLNQYGGFSDPINYLCASPTDKSFITCR